MKLDGFSNPKKKVDFVSFREVENGGERKRDRERETEHVGK